MDQELEGRTIFEIPAENHAKFEAQIAKLSRKAEKLMGVSFTPFTFSHDQVELADGKMHRVYSVLLNAVTPKVEGWTFVARLDHANETGTIIRMVPDAGELPESYRHALSTRCDHCNVNRFRRDTFVVRNDETGEFKQVGSSCLKDFFEGQDPYKIAKLAELLGYAYECGKGAEQFVGGDMRWISVEEYALCAARAVLTKGWVSGKAAYENPSLTSTREMAWAIYSHTGEWTNHHWVSGQREAFTPVETELAEAALEWAQSLRSKTEMNDYEHNISVIADATMMEPRSAGLAASIVGVFYNNRQKAQQQSMPCQVDVGDFAGVISLMQRGGSKVQHPKIRLQLEDGQPIVLSVAGSGSKYKGSVQITDGRPFGDNTWFGRVSPTGAWDRSKSVSPATMCSLTALLSALATDPAATAAKYGTLTGQCCFCHKGLEDERSMAVGYGKKCASNYDLPWGSKVA